MRVRRACRRLDVAPRVRLRRRQARRTHLPTPLAAPQGWSRWNRVFRGEGQRARTMHRAIRAR